MQNDVFAVLRGKIKEAVDAGVLDPAQEALIQGTLIQLLAEATRKQQSHEAAATRLMEQYHRELGQAEGLASVANMIQNQIQAAILRAQRDAIQAKEAEEERKTREPVAPLPKSTKK